MTLGPLFVALALLQSPALPIGAGKVAPQGADNPEAPRRDAWSRGTLEIGALGGYAEGRIFDPQRTPSPSAQVLGRFAVHFGPTFEGVMRGNFAIVLEGVGMWIDQVPAASGGGLNLLVRYTWAAGSWRPSLVGGSGVLFTDESVPPGEATRNYASQAGAGLQYLLGDHLAIGAEYRFHHLSNNNQTESNPGVNSHLVLFGVCWFH
jgi:hypothetical protein